MWQMVRTGGETYDLWTIRGVLARFEKWIRKDAGTDSATLAVQNGWYVGDRKIVTEQVEMVARPVVKRRQDLEFTIRLQAAAEPVDIAGEQKDRKGYGGINIRFAPRADTAIRTASEENAADSDLKPQPWAELTGVFEGKKAAARIAIDPANPGYPNGWCLRHYGFLGVDFPGLEPYRLTNDRWLVMKYRVTLIGD